MTNNDVLRRLRFALNLSDAEVRRLTGLMQVAVPEASLASWLAREGEPGFSLCPDLVLEALLDGLVLDRRGPPPAQPPERRPSGFGQRDAGGPAHLARFDNNMVLKKLRIALSYKESDMLNALAKGGMRMSPGELGGIFRHHGQTNFRPAGDQVVRAFLKGLTIQLRGVGGE